MSSDTERNEPIDIQGDEVIEGVTARNLLAIKDTSGDLDVQKLSAMATFLETARPKSIALTKPQDWVQMGDSVYLQATGLERFQALWGLVFGTAECTREDHSDGTYTYIFRGPAGSTRTGVFYQTVEGGRWSGDKFFEQKDNEGNLLPPDPMDIRKAAFTNWKLRAATMITGMRGLTPEDLQAEGLKSKTKVTYGTGQRGGKGKSKKEDERGVPLVPFGKCKGEPIDKIPAGNLTYLINRAGQNLESDAFAPGGEKHRYLADEKRWLGKLNDELARRQEQSGEGHADEPDAAAGDREPGAEG